MCHSGRGALESGVCVGAGGESVVPINAGNSFIIGLRLVVLCFRAWDALSRPADYIPQTAPSRHLGSVLQMTHALHLPRVTAVLPPASPLTRVLPGERADYETPTVLLSRLALVSSEETR